MSRNHICIACALTLLAFTAAPVVRAETLAELEKQTHYHGIAVNRTGSAKLLLATHHGLFALDEKGTATLVSPVQDFMGFSPHPSEALSYFASGHPATGGNLGFIASKDGGAKWEQVSPGAGGPVDFHQLDVSPADPLVVYGIYRNVQRSADGGKTWSKTGEAPARLIAIAASALDANRLYAATETGLQVSADGGATWKPAGFQSETVTLIENGPGGTLFAFVLGRGLLTANESDPAKWTPLANDFGKSIPLHFASDPGNASALYLTTHDNQVLASGDGGLVWRPFARP